MVLENKDFSITEENTNNQTFEYGIPYTFSNKKVEIAVTKIIHNMAVANRGALRNPESLDYYEKMKEEINSL